MPDLKKKKLLNQRSTHSELSLSTWELLRPIRSIILTTPERSPRPSQTAKSTKALLMCGSGTGMAISANKVKGVRAAVAWNEDIARLARQHNNANVLALPARFATKEEMANIVKAFFSTDFEGGRHAPRVDKISQIEAATTSAKNMPRILAVAGSYREHSYNKRVLNIAAEGARNAGAEVTVIDLRDFPLPIYDADMQADGAFDANALRLQDVFNEHDGFLISSPEYNGGDSGRI